MLNHSTIMAPHYSLFCLTSSTLDCKRQQENLLVFQALAYDSNNVNTLARVKHVKHHFDTCLFQSVLPMLHNSSMAQFNLKIL
ncbi:hypothetical protein JHK82_021241 [Glycine max]|uniref:Uncharacterized protein n=2 Tax=Glycine subgen. Soja TaxID=1462606 RepID=K7L6E0_SOYBN|nr:hypothetical protein JHK85_021694 [Glycine max]KAG5025340.1 hypothetical protein JHK86_021254 [Glycine max]KAG5136510.1 hypothetical protein JHK82_021241 [Glycine max]KAH1050982.1 hypothetical protein GYH30_021097 [Glycine max]RZB96688.1 hypothetical protein D0Y65_020424 [Glycine soja]